MKLSIIIPAKNEEKSLPALFDSLDAQTFQDFETIVADAASTDGTREIAKRRSAFIVPGGLPGAGRNAGAEHAHGELLLFLDADVVLPSNNFLECAIEEFQETQADVATADIAPMSDRMTDKFFFRIYNGYVHLTERIRPHAPGFCIFVKKRVHDAVRGFDEGVVFAEDHEYVQRIVKHRYVFRILRRVPPIQTSVRRFDKDGRWAIGFKFVWAELRMIFKGPFRNRSPFRYHMGGEGGTGAGG
ncbi:glycosyltransferase [Candidatus Uhrbacteria bacterium UHB]|uniref:Glycosyltransferase n=1 Tax=candidate division WWE3 bacterium TaxID=2053526 RepID=A0A928Y6H0_UNCKA|nr:glycosyltransferase [candidate division WWE3 bacterium]MDL1952673.1 glycosyltransferase [Candidatus Uhrbacteria bacterium UHB]RIL01195.1 MAG: glycosyl transferase family 2 [Candidatus Uhrbacteria bacterium]